MMNPNLENKVESEVIIEFMTDFINIAVELAI